MPHNLRPMPHPAPPTEIATEEWYLLLDADDGPVFERVQSQSVAQIALMAGIGFAYDRFAAGEREALQARCQALPPDLLDGDPAKLLAASDAQEVVLYTQVARGQAQPRYRLCAAADAPSLLDAAAHYLGAYRHSVLCATLLQFDELVIARIREAQAHRSAAALAAGLRDFHLRLLREIGLRTFLTRLVQQGDSVLLIRARDLSDYSLWLGGRELRQWVRDRGQTLDSPEVILDVEVPTLLGGLSIEAHPAPVKFLAHVSPGETIVFSHPVPRPTAPRRPRPPSAATCAQWGENITPLRRKR